jgi:hypothetical protein
MLDDVGAIGKIKLGTFDISPRIIQALVALGHREGCARYSGIFNVLREVRS